MISKTPDKILEDLTVTLTARLASKQSLLDKIDTSGWTSKDVKAFDNLIAEKRQLERNHHRMSLNDMSRLGQRKVTSADLKAPNDWKYDAESATYKYTGKHKCAIDVPDNHLCHHNLCQYAKSHGISYLEYDTIMYYAQRIASAKTSRMKDALRKQRDCQLLKDIQANEEWKEKAIKKFKSFSKDAAEALLAAASQYDKAWYPPTPENPDNVIEQVGRALSSLRMAQLSEHQKHFCRTASESLKGKHTLHWRDPSAFLEFFQSVQLSHLHAAVLNIREVFQLNGIIPYEVDYRLCAFVEELSELVQQLPRGTRNTSGFTVGQALSSFKRSIETEKISVKDDAGGQSLLCNHIVNVLNQCLAVEVKARERMRDICVRIQDDVDEQLLLIKEEAEKNSPLPYVSSVTMDLDLRQGRLHCLVRRLLDQEGEFSRSRYKIVKHVSLQLKTILVDEPSDLVEVYEELMRVLDQYFEVANNSSRKAIFKGLIEEAYSLIEPMIHEREDLEQKMKEEVEDDINATLAAAINFPVHSLPGTNITTDREIISAYIQTFWEEGYQGWAPLIAKRLWRGVSEPLFAHLAIETKTNPKFKDKKILECDFTNLMHELESHARRLTEQEYGISDYLTSCRDVGWCVPSTMLHFCILLSHVCSLNPRSAKRVLEQFSSTIEGNMACIPQEWRKPLAVVGRTILYTYGYIALDATRIFGRSDIEQFVLTLLWTLLYHSIVAVSLDEAKQNFAVAFDFMLNVLQPNRANSKPWAIKVQALFKVIIEDLQLRCYSPGLCVHTTSPFSSGDDTDVNSSERHLPSAESGTFPCAATAAEPKIHHLSTSVIIERRLKQRKDSLHDYGSHYSTLLDLVNSPHFDSLAAARVLKYVALRLRHEVESTFPVRIADLELLGYAFSRAEAQMKRTPISSFMQTLTEAELKPTSLNIGLHNHCNIWELSSCNEKCFGFWQGYRLGYRDMRDISTLLVSIKNYAIQHGSTENLETKLKRMRKCPSFPDSLESSFDGTRAISEDELQDQNLRAQLTVNRLDFLTHMTMEHSDRPDRPLLDELTEWPDGATDYFTCLETITSDLGDDPQPLKTATSSLLTDLQNGLDMRADDERISKILNIAVDVWSRTEHADIIYSDAESGDGSENTEEGSQSDSSDTSEDDMSIEPNEDTPLYIPTGKTSDASHGRHVDEVCQNLFGLISKRTGKEHSGSEKRTNELATGIGQPMNGTNKLVQCDDVSSKDLQTPGLRSHRSILEPVSVENQSRSSSVQPQPLLQQPSTTPSPNINIHVSHDGEPDPLLSEKIYFESFDNLKQLTLLPSGNGIAATHSSASTIDVMKKENKIMIQTPDIVPRGRKPALQTWPRSVKSRSPTPYPFLNDCSPLLKRSAWIHSNIHASLSSQPSQENTTLISPTEETDQDNIFLSDDMDNVYPETCMLSSNSQIPGRVDALQNSMLSLLELTLKGTPVNDLMCKDTEGTETLKGLWTSLAAVNATCSDLVAQIGINESGRNHEEDGSMGNGEGHSGSSENSSEDKSDK